MSKPSTMCAAFQATATAHADHVALRTPGDQVRLTWEQYAERVRRIAAGLAALGVRPGDTIALMMTNRLEFHLVDIAELTGLLTLPGWPRGMRVPASSPRPHVVSADL